LTKSMFGHKFMSVFFISQDSVGLSLACHISTWDCLCSSIISHLQSRHQQEMATKPTDNCTDYSTYSRYR